MWRRAAGFGLFAALVGLASVAACRQLVGITDNPPEDLVTSICGLPYGTNTCASCVNMSCCTESTTCAADPTCAAYEGCLGKCNGDPACRSQCTIYPVSTASDVSALSACLATNCEAACRLACGGIAGLISEPPSATSCQSCIEATPTTCAHARDWGSSVDGDAYWRCVLACPTPDCISACGIHNPSGASLFAPFQADYAGTCAGPCAYGNYWACVGHVSWPSAKSKTSVATFSVIDSATQHGVPGLDIKACNECPCGTPANPALQDAQTNDAGVVTSTIPIAIVGSSIGLEACYQITSPSMTYYPEFGYPGFPYSEPVDIAPADLNAGVSAPGYLAGQLALINVTQEPALGWVVAAVHDCLGSQAPGVQVQVTTSDAGDSGINVYYQVGSEAEATPQNGQASFFNVPPGLLTLTATPLALGKPSSVEVVNVAAGTFTGVYMVPTPTP